MTDKAPKPDDSGPFGTWLNRKLSGIFDDLAQEPLPQSIIDLARKVEAQDAPPQQTSSASLPPAEPDACVKPGG
ncbi:MAG: hypothetical protein JNM81_06540 [Rhodospirillaceae bacterium]|nr:hypothetical protein [Rhodospirillaceae bacterium]